MGALRESGDKADFPLVMLFLWVGGAWEVPC